MFRRKKQPMKAVYDKTGKVPVIRSSICTGEQVLGFRDEVTGKFQEIMLLRREEDLRQFLQEYGVEESELRKEW